jgi:tetratricopeptide (TPR) repeat protein
MLNHDVRGGAMRTVSLATVIVVGLASAGCTQYKVLQARRAIKAANQAYKAQDYKHAAELYEEAIGNDPNLNGGYFYLGNSYEQLYKPSRKGEKENDALLEKAIQNYQTSAERLATSSEPSEKNLANLSLKYLVAAYGVDKMNDPGKAEPILIKMIELDPKEPENYFMLANVYEQAGLYPDAERVYNLARDAKPADPAVYLQLAGYYNRQGVFEKTIAALEQRAEKEPKNPEAFQMIAGYYYEEANGDNRLRDEERRDYIMKGLEAADKAIQLKPDYPEALTFKGLLFRQQARIEKDPAKAQQLLKDGTELGERANALRKKQAAGAD